MEDNMSTFTRKLLIGRKGFVVGVRDEGVDVARLRCEYFPQKKRHFEIGD